MKCNTFLSPCTNFSKPLKEKFRWLSVQPGPRGSNDLHVGRKMATFQLFFQSREQVVVQRGQIWRIGWVMKTLEAQVGQFLLGCRCPVSRGIVVQEQHPYIIDTKESQVADITIRHKKAEILQSRRYEFSSILNFN